MYEISDRYSALGIERPNEKTICRGECEGVGFYPHYTGYKHLFVNQPTEYEATEQLLWDESHRKESWKSLGLHILFCDGWHFIRCPKCYGRGRRDGKSVWENSK